jgi:hypothetical protein
MIDTEKMRFMATRLRAMDLTTCTEAADAIDTLLAALDQNHIDQLEAQGAYEELDRENNGLRAARIAHASEFPPDAEGLPDVGNVHANIRKLKSALEASDQKRKEAALEAEKAREERNRVHVKLNAEWIRRTAKLRAALEAAAADNARLRECALKYLTYLDVADAVSGLERDLRDPNMVGSALSQRQEES